MMPTRKRTTPYKMKIGEQVYDARDESRRGILLGLSRYFGRVEVGGKRVRIDRRWLRSVRVQVTPAGEMAMDVRDS